MTDPYSGLHDFINFMIHSPDLQSNDNNPLTMDTCSTYMSHMYNIRYPKEMWETTIYPLYVERFNLVRKPKT